MVANGCDLSCVEDLPIRYTKLTSRDNYSAKACPACQEPAAGPDIRLGGAVLVAAVGVDFVSQILDNEPNAAL